MFYLHPVLKLAKTVPGIDVEVGARGEHGARAYNRVLGESLYWSPGAEPLIRRGLKLKAFQFLNALICLFLCIFIFCVLFGGDFLSLGSGSDAWK